MEDIAIDGLQIGMLQDGVDEVLPVTMWTWKLCNVFVNTSVNICDWHKTVFYY